MRSSAARSNLLVPEVREVMDIRQASEYLGISPVGPFKLVSLDIKLSQAAHQPGGQPLELGPLLAGTRLRLDGRGVCVAGGQAATRRGSAVSWSGRSRIMRR